MKAAPKKIAPTPTAAPVTRPAPIEHEPPDVGAMVESIIGCKWSLLVLEMVRSGINRPGALVRSTDGLTTKVLNERLAKMLRFGILSRRAYPEVPPRVEYALTPFGERFVEILDAVERLKRDAVSGNVSPDVPPDSD